MIRLYLLNKPTLQQTTVSGFRISVCLLPENFQIYALPPMASILTALVFPTPNSGAIWTALPKSLKLCAHSGFINLRPFERFPTSVDLFSSSDFWSKAHFGLGSMNAASLTALTKHLYPTVSPPAISCSNYVLQKKFMKSQRTAIKNLSDMAEWRLLQPQRAANLYKGEKWSVKSAFSCYSMSESTLLLAFSQRQKQVITLTPTPTAYVAGISSFKFTV